MKSILITGSSGFIGFHMSKLLLEDGYKVIGFDSMNNYYDINIKKERLKILKKHRNFKFYKNKLENLVCLKKVFQENALDYVIHLAAQAGVRHSIDNPAEYINANIIGTFNILECSKIYNIKHLLAASTSSVYGANDSMPFKESENTNTPMSVYAATKISTESIGHSYSYNWNLPITFFRFFTVYGPWGRPDMALFKFTKNILENKKIELYNSGNMYRDFTYVEDLVSNISALIKKIPKKNDNYKISNIKGSSPVAPFRVINIGNAKKIYLLDFVKIIEDKIGIRAKIKNLKMQKGDVYATHANIQQLQYLTNSKIKTSVKKGVSEFVDWYKLFYKIK